MPELWLDEDKLDIETTKPWGELLAQVESDHLGASRLIRTIAFDGEEIDDFRAEALTERRLEELSRVDVVSVGLEDFSRELLAKAPGHLDQVAQVLTETVALYRQDLPTQGATKLHSALTGFDMLMQLAATIAAVWHEELRDLEGSEAMTDESLESLRVALETLVRCQESGEIGRIADVVEQELIPRLEPWGSLLRELDRRVQSGTDGAAPS